MSNRADNITIDHRIRTIIDWVTSAYSTKDIIAQCNLKWGIDERQVYKYLSEIKKQFKEARKGKINERIDYYIALKTKLYNELKAKDTPAGASVANNIIDSMAKLEGLYVDKVDLTSKGKELKAQTEQPKVYKATLKLN